MMIMVIVVVAAAIIIIINDHIYTRIYLWNILDETRLDNSCVYRRISHIIV